MAVIASETKQSVGLMREYSNTTLSVKLNDEMEFNIFFINQTDWFNETPIRCTRNDKTHSFTQTPNPQTFSPKPPPNPSLTIYLKWWNKYF